MLSLYIHTPFCKQKCSYCNFFVSPTDKMEDSNSFVNNYIDSLKSQIDFFAEKFPKEEIKTIYFWWWTPLELWKENIFSIVDKIIDKFDTSLCEEISFELNPDPFNDVLDFVASFNKKYKNFFRIRYSFGLQSLNDDVLKSTWRNYVYNTLIWFIRDLTEYKQANNIFNFDFIAFGAIDYKWQWLPDYKKFFLTNFINSSFADSFSLYTLELFPWSFMYNNYSPNDDLIYEEFDNYKNLLFDWWYKRYEISNFELPWKRSLHNMVYWNLEEYLGLWMWASSFLKKDKAFKIFDDLWEEHLAVRFETSKVWKDFFNNNFDKFNNISKLNNKDLLLEEFFLWLRTKEWIADFEKYSDILVDDWENIKNDLEESYYLKTKNWRTFLKSKWMDVYNTIINKLLKDF